jgi:hypothetical protein
VIQDVRDTDESLVALAHERLGQARRAAKKGRFAEALAGYEWFHEHALDGCPGSLYGVRLSFALNYWRDLGDAYPTAKLALRACCEAKIQALMEGKGDRDLLNDVISMQDYIEGDDFVYPVVLSLNEHTPRLLRECWHSVTPVLLAHRNFELAEAVYGDPLKRTQGFIESLQEQLAYKFEPMEGASDFDRVHLEATIGNFVDMANGLLQTLVKNGKRNLAVELREIILSRLECDDLVKQSLSAGLTVAN